MRNTRTALTADLAKRSLASLGRSRACDVRNIRSYVVAAHEAPTLENFATME